MPRFSLQRRQLGVLLAAVWAVPACAAEAFQRKALHGSWMHRVSVIGQREDSLVTFWPNGRFREDAVSAEPPAQGQADSAALKLSSLAERHGRWRLCGRDLTMIYIRASDGHPAKFTEVRAITELSKTRFVSVDPRFGIAIARDRMPTVQYTVVPDK